MSCSLKEKAEVKVKKSKCKFPSLNDEKCLLSEMLSCYSKDDLTEIRRSLKIKGVSKLSKKDLITFLDEYIETNFDGILENLDFNQYLFLNRYFEEKEYLINNKEFYNDVVQSLKNYGIVFPVTVDNKFNLVIPINITKLLEDKLINNHELNLGFSLSKDILKVISEIIYYYGVLKFDDLYNVVSEVTKKLTYIDSQKLEVEFDKEYLENLLQESNCMYYGIKKQDDLIFNENVYDANYIVMAHEKLNHIEYYDIQSYEKGYKGVLEEDISMIEELKECLSKDILLSKEKIDTISNNSLFFLKNGLNIDYIMENLKDAINLKNGSIEEDFKNKLYDINFRIRKWCLKGYNEKEIRNVNNTNVHIKNPSEKVKVGRNDPCPCGSGKKYKKCCMKRLKADR